MWQAAREEVVNRSHRNAQAGGELPFVFVVWSWRLARAWNCRLIFVHIAFRATALFAVLMCASILRKTRIVFNFFPKWRQVGASAGKWGQVREMIPAF
jgi:hypothetical protein